MSISHDIRGALSQSGEPMTGREICDATGCETPEERNRVYKTIAAMACKRLGIEKIDGGKVALIPGWKPKRGPADLKRNPSAVADSIKGRLDRGTLQAGQGSTASIIEQITSCGAARPESLQALLHEAQQLEYASRLAVAAAERLRRRIEESIA